MVRRRSATTGRRPRGTAGAGRVPTRAQAARMDRSTFHITDDAIRTRCGQRVNEVGAVCRDPRLVPGVTFCAGCIAA